MGNFYINQKFIHWATRGRLNNHCNNKDLLGTKQKIMATGFLHTSGIQAWSAIFNSLQSHELYMGVLAIEWRISQHLREPDTMTWDQAMDHFLKVCKQFA